MKTMKIIMQAILIALMMHLVSAAVLEADIIVGREKSVVSLKVMEGRAGAYINETGDYRLEIKDAAGNTLWARNYDVRFIVLTNPPRIADYELITEKIAYDEKMYELYFYRNADVLLHRYLDFCDANSICNRKENAVSCPADCSVADYDGICISKADGICDPDCINDSDCVKIEKKRKRLWIAAVIAFAVSVIAGMCVVHFERRKMKIWIKELKAAMEKIRRKVYK